MSTTIRIKRTTTAGDPAVLGDGVLAYSGADSSSVAGGGRLYVGLGVETFGDAASHIVIGGQFFTDMLDHGKGVLTANSALVTDADSKLDNIKIDNIDINGNTISSTDVNGNIVLAPQGTGAVSLSDKRIINVADPVNAQDVVTKSYLESEVNLEYFQDDIATMITTGTQNGIAVTYDDSGNTIGFDVNDFTVTLGGGFLTGSVDITNLASATLNATIVNDSIILGTHTSGEYVENLTAGTGVYITNPTGESSNPTISIGQAVDITSNVTFADVYATGSLQIDGNLVVGGTSTTLSATNLSITDNMIMLNHAAQKNISDAVGDGSDVVFTTSTKHGYLVGMHAKVTGVSPATFNATYDTITAVTDFTFTVASTNTDTFVSGGTARGQTSSNPDVGFAAGYDDGTYANTGFFRDSTDGVYKIFDSYTLEPDLSVFIDTSHSSFALAQMQASNFIGPLQGNADTATILATARTISLSGDVSGFVTFDGSQSVDIAAVIQPNSVQLGIDTFGSYIATLADAGNTNIVVNNSGTETAGVTLDLTDSGVTAASYGSQTAIPVFTVDVKGRITTASTVTIATQLGISDGSNQDLVDLLVDELVFTGGVGLTSTISDNTVTYDLDNTAVVADTYAAANSVGIFTVDAQGRLTYANTQIIDITSGQVNDFTEAVQDKIAEAIAAGTQSNIAVTYTDISNSIDFSVATATYSTLGVAKFSSTNFTVAAGNVTVTTVDGGTS
jgi:hypothetical protein